MKSNTSERRVWIFHIFYTEDFLLLCIDQYTFFFFLCDVEKEVNSESLNVFTSANVYIKSLLAVLESQICVICLCDFYPVILHILTTQKRLKLNFYKFDIMNRVVC